MVSLEDGADPLIEGRNKTLSLKLNVEVNMDVTIEIIPQSMTYYTWRVFIRMPYVKWLSDEPTRD